MKIILITVICYLIGSIPVGYLFSRRRGIDIRRCGSGNIGTTNVWRSLGPAAGMAVLAGDMLKGFVAVWLGRCLIGPDGQFLTATAALIGHSWPVFLGFQGGKIIATTFGALILIDPLATVIAVVLWLVVVGVSRYVSLGSVLTAASLPVIMLALGRSWKYAVFALAVAVIALYKHWPNIRRLLSGKEFRIGRL